MKDVWTQYTLQLCLLAVIVIVLINYQVLKCFNYTLIIIFYVKICAKSADIQAAQTYKLTEDGQDLRPKHVGVIINTNIVQQVGSKYCKCKEVEWRCTVPNSYRFLGYQLLVTSNLCPTLTHVGLAKNSGNLTIKKVSYRNS
jgi:hypothetical protein